MSYEACPNTNEACKYYPECYADEHHLVWPKKNYKSPIEREYRSLPEHRVTICRAEHDEIHATERPPRKPSRNEMLQAIAATALQEAS